MALIGCVPPSTPPSGSLGPSRVPGSTVARATDAPRPHAAPGRAPRARDLGIPFSGTPGPLGAITDVAGVEVGHRTLIEGDRVRTGVTAIFPRGRAAAEGVFAAWATLNGNGEMTGTTFIDETGWLGGPVLLTGTESVGLARDAAITWMLKHYKEREVSLLPVVGETWDGWLNDLPGMHVHATDVVAALDAAAPGPVAEGSVGGGTGMVCHGFKGGIGTTSRRVHTKVGDFVVGVLVQCNYGRRSQLRIAGVPMEPGLTAPPDTRPKPEQGSILVIVATDAPLLPMQLKRLAKRVPLGIGRMGGIGGIESGDLFLAFSTANRNAATDEGIATIKMFPDPEIDPLLEATIDGTEEAIVNAMVAADRMIGIDGHTVERLPHDRVREILRAHGR